MENADGDGKPSAGPGGGPALKAFSGAGEQGNHVCEKGQESDLARMMDDARAMIGGFFQRHKGAGAGGGGGTATIIKCLGVAFMAFCVEQGYSDGDEFNEVGCTVAQQPGGTSYGARPGRPRERDGGKRDDAEGECAAGGSPGEAGRPACEVRGERCPHRVADGQCQRWKGPCRLVLSVGHVSEVVAQIHREVAAVRTEFVELRTAKERLQKMLADGLFAFTRKVDATSFKVLCTILAEGDVAKASRNLEMADSTMREMLRAWRGRGKEYQAMLELVRWRKDVRRRKTVTFNDKVLLGTAQSVDYPGILSDVLDGLLDMNQGNWDEQCDKLVEMLRGVAR